MKINNSFLMEKKEVIKTVITPQCEEVNKKKSLNNIVDRIVCRFDVGGNKHRLAGAQLNRLIEALQNFNLNTLKNLESFGLKIFVIEPCNIPSINLPSDQLHLLKKYIKEDGNGGIYLSSFKTIALNTDCGFSLNKSIIIHETAHAIDDMLIRGNDGEKLLQKLYSNYKNSNPSNIWSERALVNSKEYLAEGVEWFYNGDRGGCKEELKNKDPLMYKYVKKFLKMGSQSILLTD